MQYTTGLLRNDTAFMDAYVSGNKEVTQTFSISGIYCEPKGGAKSDNLIVAVHGIGFDSAYWNFGGDLGVPQNEYSFIYEATKAGYATFRYDRLGTGESEKPEDGYNVVQGPTEVGILTSIANKVKNTKDIGGKKWGKTILVGHSYGSVQSAALAAARPDLVDSLVLTGFSTYTMGLPQYLTSTVYTMARMVFPKRLGNLPDSYLVTGTQYSGQQNFAYPYYVTSAANELQRNTEQAVTQGSLFTIGSLAAPSPNFKGTVRVILPEKDFIFALAQGIQNGRNLAEEAVKSLYPAASNQTWSVPANTGHGYAFHVTAGKINRDIVSFVKSNGY